MISYYNILLLMVKIFFFGLVRFLFGLLGIVFCVGIGYFRIGLVLWFNSGIYCFFFFSFLGFMNKCCIIEVFCYG